jgi:hypothetical protein
MVVNRLLFLKEVAVMRAILRILVGLSLVSRSAGAAAQIGQMRRARRKVTDDQGGVLPGVI